MKKLRIYLENYAQSTRPNGTSAAKVKKRPKIALIREIPNIFHWAATLPRRVIRIKIPKPIIKTSPTTRSSNFRLWTGKTLSQ